MIIDVYRRIPIVYRFSSVVPQGRLADSSVQGYTWMCTRLYLLWSASIKLSPSSAYHLFDKVVILLLQINSQ